MTFGRMLPLIESLWQDYVTKDVPNCATPGISPWINSAAMTRFIGRYYETRGPQEQGVLRPRPLDQPPQEAAPAADAPAAPARASARRRVRLEVCSHQGCQQPAAWRCAACVPLLRLPEDILVASLCRGGLL